MGRRLGQHFLADPAILDRIVDALEPRPDDAVIEIGPGQGTLTHRLAPRVGCVIAIERDRVLAQALQEEDVQRATYKVQRAVRPGLADNVTVVEGDALELRWQDLFSDRTLHLARCTSSGFKVIGNIPYYITTPLIQRALTPPLPEVVVFLMQREVADRLAAEPGSKTYGALSAGVQAVAGVERLFVVRKGSFRPPPKVDSAVVRLRPLARPLVEPAQQEAWRAFLAGLFSQRRKQLVRSLRTLTGQSKDAVEALLADVGVDPTARPEALSPSELVRLFARAPR